MARKLKIYKQSMSGTNYTQVPTIILKGQWLKEAGFNFGEYVEVICEGEKIILSKTLDSKENTVKSLEEKIKSLDRKQKAKLSEMIDKL